MANISRVTDQLWTGGDLPSHRGRDAMLADLLEIRAAGITHILDTRLEWSDEEFVREHAPSIVYLWHGEDDAGQRMPDEWFARGVERALSAMSEPENQVLVHCHMGINRGPSLAFAVLLAQGVPPVRALTAIRRARPIAAIDYSRDALGWWQRFDRTPPSLARRQQEAVARWHARYPLDVVRIIRRVRLNEYLGLPLDSA